MKGYDKFLTEIWEKHNGSLGDVVYFIRVCEIIIDKVKRDSHKDFEASYIDILNKEFSEYIRLHNKFSKYFDL